jgi:hypothetical protein
MADDRFEWRLKIKASPELIENGFRLDDSDLKDFLLLSHAGFENQLEVNVVSAPDPNTLLSKEQFLEKLLSKVVDCVVAGRTLPAALLEVGEVNGLGKEETNLLKKKFVELCKVATVAT